MKNQPITFLTISFLLFLSWNTTFEAFEMIKTNSSIDFDFLSLIKLELVIL